MDEKYFVITGRPNAGKSSLIKEIFGLNVQIGKKPGTTRKFSEYCLSDGLILVDMPGFGRMMGRSKFFEIKINDQIIDFLEINASKIVLAVHIFDVSTFLEVTERLGKKGFISVDVEMVNLLVKNIGEYPIVVANKIDKVGKKQVETNLKEFTKQTGINDSSIIEKNIFPVSIKKREKVGILKNAIHKRLVDKGYQTPFRIKK